VPAEAAHPRFPPAPTRPTVRVDGMVRRGLAGLLDLALSGLLFGVAAFALRWFPFVPLEARRWNTFDWVVDTVNAHLPDLGLSAAFFLLVALFVGLVPEVVWGASFGRLLVGSTVLDTHGRPASVARLILRNVFRVLEVPLLGLGVWLGLVLPSRRMLHDVLSGTVIGRPQ